jgi:UDP-N-acetyl-D-glucosamine/UDP-N-acetyl-D-galactosamine dehydrogenase
MSDVIAVIGLGYVGLPLAVEFGKKYKTIGFDINEHRIDELKRDIDHTQEISSEQLKQARLHYTNDINVLKTANFYIITVPTPIDPHKKPDLKPLIHASETVGSVLKKNDIVVYESTVYPGATEEQCVPVLEKCSGLLYNQDFFCGYSPERINPGDKQHTVSSIKKITSGSTPKIAEKIDILYQSIIKAGTYRAPSIKVAEAAKVIENAQRDINIAFVNELAIIFNKLNIDSGEVLQAAATKWNFLSFKPGLVGGHCIGVDPYYLAYKSQEVGYHPEIILAGRRLNDNMGIYIANQVIKLMIKKEHKIAGSRVLVLGITFKENCPDIRNSKVIDVVRELEDFECNVDVYDPWAEKEEVRREYNIHLVENIQDCYDVVICAVNHALFEDIDFNKLRKNDASVVYDVKGAIDVLHVDARL